MPRDAEGEKINKGRAPYYGNWISTIDGDLKLGIGCQACELQGGLAAGSEGSTGVVY